ncbi:rod shape-determining protein MreC [Pontixanthobacter aestiaquae]|uniref:Cell shape-determining protein MreC n=1 Tax=Pontixanthobacter aestiaquae TaxID=1509367 RepID=A0A844ZCH1_9SPHN|nr:rod shape-determining protein MreC [Pontixanthobacter aestiaquae]MDN3645482.1 rod shape-determining protein MreC [Pontixanthobacter aestiaquae]MXO83519.1 rod shape-determining protein MreC [Pontixanthobacter aestiaquae]
MASSNRRSSNSRRAQYGVFTGYVLAGIGALIGAVLLGLSLWRPASFDGPRGVAQDVVEPVGTASAEVRTGGQGLIASISGYLQAGSQNAELKREVEIARIRLKEAKAVEQENARLKALLGLAQQDIEPLAVTKFIGSTAASTRRFGYIGAGASDGIEVGMPVRSERGVVGRILEVASSTSRVLLLTDSQSVLPVRLAREDVVAFAEGRGDGLLQIRLINLGINPLEVGDVMVTSGTGGYYRPGIAVAIISEIVDDGAIARIISDPAATDFVSVEPIWQPEALIASKTPDSTPLTETGSQ